MIWVRFCIVLIAFLLNNCSDQQYILDEHILARVGEKTITIQDFIRRAEYSIRPDYCRNSNYIHKKIVLNSLIAEKLLALEIENKKEDQLNSPNFQAFLKGRKEQAMRQVFYHKKFYSTINIKENIIEKNYKSAGRTIKVNYLNLPDLKMFQKIQRIHREGVSLDSIYASLWDGAIPVRFINWFDREPREIHDKLFNSNLKKGQLLGPFQTENNSYLILEVSEWIDQPVITESEQELRWLDTKERLTEISAKELYENYVKELMSGHQMKLNQDVFNAYASIAVDYYLKDEIEQKEAMNKAIWNNNLPEELNYFEPSQDLDQAGILFNYRNKNWSVSSFNKLLKFHPLVFRKRKMSRGEFRVQLKFAIADLLRDVEITNRCYDLGLDNDWRVVENENQWYDAYASKRHIQLSFPEPVAMQQILDYYNPIIDSLQQVYSNKIQINTKALEELNLTSTDMMVTQKGVPYPVVVPSFPIITTNDRLDYGSKLE